MELTGRQVLVVDDDEAVRTTLSDTLRHYGYLVRAVADPQEGLRLLASDDFAAALVDIRMPTMSGHAFVRAASELPTQVAVVLMSGLADVNDVAEGFRTGIQDFVAKPFTAREIIAILDRITVKRRSGSERASRAVSNRPSGPRAETAETTDREHGPSSGLGDELQAEIMSLPVPEPMLLRLSQALDDPTLGAAHAAALLERIPNLAAKLLHLSNSTMYARHGPPITSVRDAVIRLGPHMAINIAQTQLLQGCLVPAAGRFIEPAKKLWENAMATAALARMIGDQVRQLNPDEAYHTALFHNAGELLILRMAMQAEERPGQALSLEDVAGEIAQHHTEVGYLLCKTWHLNDLTCDTARRHHDRELYSDHTSITPLVIRSCCCVLADHLATHLNGEALPLRVAEPSLEQCQRLLGLSDSHIGFLSRAGKESLAAFRGAMSSA